MAKVLLVTADFDAGYRLRSALKGAGHQVSLHFRADDALRVLEHEHFQLLACDPVLPGMFGTDLINAARRALGNADLPAILLQSLPERLEYELSNAHPVKILPARSSAALQHAIEQFTTGAGGGQEQPRIDDESASAGGNRASRAAGRGGHA